MNRRAFVGLLALFSGCSTRFPLSDTGGLDDRNPNAVPASSPPRITNVTQPANPAPNPPSQQGDTPSTEPAGEPATEPVEESRTEPTEEPDSDSEADAPQKLTERERRGLFHIERAERRLDAVVAAFSDGYGSELTDVTASSVGFVKSNYEIQVALAEAQKRHLEASKWTANAEQDMVAERLVRIWRFLKDATRTQLAVVEGYLALEDVLTALAENDAKVALFAVEDLKTVRWKAEREYGNVVESSSVADVVVISSISAEEYEAKVAQFGADIALYRELDETLRQYADGVKWLARAKREFYEKPRRIAQSRDSAKEARNYLNPVRNQLNQLKKNGGEGATITPLIDELQDLAKSQISEAQEIINS